MKHFSHFFSNRAPTLTVPKALFMVIFGAMLASGLVITSNFVIEPTMAAAGNFEMMDQKPLFSAGTTPQFRVKTVPTLREYVVQRSIKSNNNIGDIGTKVLDDENRPVDLQTKVQFNRQNASEFEVLISNDKDFRPGRYQLETVIKNGVKEVTLKQDFLWGVLAINLDRSTYQPGQTVSAMLAVLNDSGVTLCNASLDLSITDPSGQVAHRSTASGEIITNPICEDKRVTNTPDYFTSFKVEKTGVYHLTLTAETKNGRRLIRASFEVLSNPDFVVSRPATSMRIYPPSDYTVKINLTANRDFNGQISETAPASFKISNAQAVIKRQNNMISSSLLSATVAPMDNRQSIKWDNIQLTAGDTVHLEYTYRAPPISPEFYLLGPLELQSGGCDTENCLPAEASAQAGKLKIDNSTRWQEPRAWQVASDAVVTWDGGGTDGTCGGVAGDGNKWSCALNWSGDVLPGSAGADIATFNATSTKNANITGAAGITIGGIDIATGYTGTITNQVNTGTAVTLTTSFSQVTGTFDGGSTANIDNNGTFSLTGGTFTSTSGTFFVASTFTISGTPTFTHNSGTFTFDTSAVTLTPSTATFYKVSFTSAVAKTIADSQTLTVANTLTLTDGSIAQTTIPAGGSIAAQGDVTQASTFDGGTGKLVLSGSGTQTFTGGGSTTSGELPDIEINATGTVILASTIRTKQDWTYTAGTISEGTSTVTFSLGGTSTSAIITGSMTFKNLTLNTTSNNVLTLTVASGATVLVNGTLTLDATVGTTISLDGPGAISAKGDVLMTGDVSDSGWGGTAVVTINGTGAQALTGTTNSGVAFNRLPAVVVNKAAGLLSITNIIQPSSGWTYTAGTMSIGTSTFEFNALQTITGTMSFYNLSFLKVGNTTSTITIASGTTLTVTNTLTLHKTNVQGSEALNGPGAITLTGNLALTGTAGTSSGWGGTAIITINGAGDQSITGTTDTGVTYNRLPAVTIAKSTGTLTFTNNLHFYNNFTYTSGNVTVGTSEVMFSGTSTVTGSFTFYDLKFEKTTATAMAVTIALGTILTVSNTLTLNHTQATGTETIDGPGTITANGNISVTGSTGTAGMNGSVAITIAGGSNTTFTTNTTTFPTGDVTINKTAGFKVSLLANTTFAGASQDLTISGGTLDLDGFNLTVNGTSGTLVVNTGGNLQLAGSETVTANTNYPQLDAGSTVTYDGTAASYTIKTYTYRNLTIAGAASTVFTLPSNQTLVQTLTITTGIFALGGFNLTATTLVNNDTFRLQGNETVSITTMDTDTGTVQYIGRNVAETLTIKDFGAGDYYSLTINDANVSKATFQSGAALDINGNLTLTAGTFNPNSFNTNIAGNWSNASSGNFLTGASTVIFDGTGTSNITGATSFSNFTSTTAGKVLKFEAQSGGAPVFTISGTFTVTGSSAYPIAIRSTIAGTQWLPHFLSTQTAVTYAYIEDSGCDVGTASVAPGVTNVYAGNNNGTCWTLPLKSRVSGGTVRIGGGTVRYQY